MRIRNLTIILSFGLAMFAVAGDARVEAAPEVPAIGIPGPEVEAALRGFDRENGTGPDALTAGTIGRDGRPQRIASHDVDADPPAAARAGALRRAPRLPCARK